MSIRNMDRKGKKALLTDNSKAVKTALKSMQGVQRDIDERNDGIMNSLLNIDPHDIDEQPAIIRHAVADIREEVLDDNRDIKDDSIGAYKCRVKNCHRDITFLSLEALVQHTNDAHANVKWTKDKLSKYQCLYCTKCLKIFIVSAGVCTHLQPKNNCTDMDLFPAESWSITVSACKTDVPRIVLQRFSHFLDNVGCKLGIACLERGDKENNLHLQAAAEINWNRNDNKSLTKKLRNDLNLDEFKDLYFKVSVKLFEAGQTWMGMVGYCQKVSVTILCNVVNNVE